MTSLDEETKGPHENFTITQIQPECSSVLSSHWESLVSPGWEFKIEFSRGIRILESIREEKRYIEKERQSPKSENSDDEASEKGDEEPVPVEKMSKIVYVANYLAPDSDGDYRSRTVERKEEKIQIIRSPEMQSRNSVLEEHREVYFSDRHATNLKQEMVDTIGNPVLYIHSPILLDALRAIIDFQSIPDEFRPKEWRAKSFSSDLNRARFVYPFVDLYHYREKLLGYRDVVKECHDEGYSTTCVEHIDILNEYLEGLTEIGLEDAERLASGPIPKTTFTHLWLLLKPGTDVYVREEGKLNAYVIESFVGGFNWSSRSARSGPHHVNVWNLNFDGQHLTRSVKSVAIPVFDHERNIDSLPVYPVRFHVDEDPENTLHQQLVNRGKRFVEMMRQPSFQEYSGPSKLQGIRTVSSTPYMTWPSRPLVHPVS